MRQVKACLQCRNGKRRCDRAGTGGLACRQCVQRNLSCSAAADPRAAPGIPGPSPQQSPAASHRPDEETLCLVDLYFRYMHDKPHSLFHEPSFKAGVLAGTISKPVLLSMMGLSARYAQHDSHYPDPVFLIFHHLLGLTRAQVRSRSRHTISRAGLFRAGQEGSQGRPRACMY